MTRHAILASSGKLRTSASRYSNRLSPRRANILTASSIRHSTRPSQPFCAAFNHNRRLPSCHSSQSRTMLTSSRSCDTPYFANPVEVGPVAGATDPRVIVSISSTSGITTSAGTSTEAGEELDERCQDVGNVVLLEHLNLEVPDLEAARLFFAEGLGLTPDPGTTGAQRGGHHVVWYNCGKQQFHIARGPAAQRLPPGSVVGLVMPDVPAVAERLEAVRQILGDVSLTYARGDTLEAVDPYGNTYAVHASLPYFPGRRGLAYLQLPCFPGTAPAIAAFYASRLGARCRVSAPGPAAAAAATGGAGGGSAGDDGGDRRAGSGGGVGSSDGGPVRAEVWLGPGQRLLFVEQAQLGPVSEQAVASLFDGWHIAIYVADFSRTFRAVHHPDLPPFNDHPYRDKYHNLQDALRNRQFRFRDIRVYDEEDGGNIDKSLAPSGGDGGGSGTAGGRLVYRISHEVRSMHHPQYGRPLYGRETGFM